MATTFQGQAGACLYDRFPGFKISVGHFLSLQRDLQLFVFAPFGAEKLACCLMCMVRLVLTYLKAAWLSYNF